MTVSQPSFSLVKEDNNTLMLYSRTKKTVFVKANSRANGNLQVFKIRLFLSLIRHKIKLGRIKSRYFPQNTYSKYNIYKSNETCQYTV